MQGLSVSSPKDDFTNWHSVESDLSTQYQRQIQFLLRRYLIQIKRLWEKEEEIFFNLDHQYSQLIEIKKEEQRTFGSNNSSSKRKDNSGNNNNNNGNKTNRSNSSNISSSKHKRTNSTRSNKVCQSNKLLVSINIDVKQVSNDFTSPKNNSTSYFTSHSNSNSGHGSSVTNVNKISNKYNRPARHSKSKSKSKLSRLKAKSSIKRKGAASATVSVQIDPNPTYHHGRDTSDSMTVTSVSTSKEIHNVNSKHNNNNDNINNSNTANANNNHNSNNNSINNSKNNNNNNNSGKDSIGAHRRVKGSHSHSGVKVRRTSMRSLKSLPIDENKAQQSDVESSLGGGGRGSISLHASVGQAVNTYMMYGNHSHSLRFEVSESKDDSLLSDTSVDSAYLTDVPEMLTDIIEETLNYDSDIGYDSVLNYNDSMWNDGATTDTNTNTNINDRELLKSRMITTVSANTANETETEVENDNINNNNNDQSIKKRLNQGSLVASGIEDSIPKTTGQITPDPNENDDNDDNDDMLANHPHVAVVNFKEDIIDNDKSRDNLKDRERDRDADGDDDSKSESVKSEEKSKGYNGARRGTANSNSGSNSSSSTIYPQIKIMANRIGNAEKNSMAIRTDGVTVSTIVSNTNTNTNTNGNINGNSNSNINKTRKSLTKSKVQIAIDRTTNTRTVTVAPDSKEIEKTNENENGEEEKTQSPSGNNNNNNNNSNNNNNNNNKDNNIGIEVPLPTRNQLPFIVNDRDASASVDASVTLSGDSPHKDTPRSGTGESEFLDPAVVAQNRRKLPKFRFSKRSIAKHVKFKRRGKTKTNDEQTENSNNNSKNNSTTAAGNGNGNKENDKNVNKSKNSKTKPSPRSRSRSKRRRRKVKVKYRINDESFILYDYYKPLKLIGTGAYAVVWYVFFLIVKVPKSFLCVFIFVFFLTRRKLLANIKIAKKIIYDTYGI